MVKTARGLTTFAGGWSSQKDENDKIIIPFAFHADYPPDKRAIAIKYMEEMNVDFGCVVTRYIREAELNRIET